MGRLQRLGVSGRGLVVALPYCWLVLFFVVPFIIVLKISFSDVDLAIPPYKPLIEWVGKNSLAIKVNLNNYAFLFTDSLYLHAFANSLKVAFLSTLMCLIIGYPMAYGIARARPAVRNVLLLLVILPFWTSLLLRVYAWIGLLKANGVINNILLSLGIIHEPLTMLYTPFAMYVGIVYSYLPFLILPLRESRENGLAVTGSCRGPRVQAVAGVLQDHTAAVPQRHPGRIHAGIHSRGRRVRHSGPIGRT
jgi:putrescine transport system permease protein